MTRTPIALHPLLTLGLLILVGSALGCDLPLHRASETESDVFKTGANPKIIVETFNGSIDISNGLEDEVAVEVTKHASGFDQQSAELNLERIEVVMSAENDEVHVRIKRIGSSLGNSGASVVIAAPPNAIVELKSSNGYIVSEGMKASLAAKTSNAKIDIVEASGNIHVQSSNGPILIEAADAHIEAKTSNASIRFRGNLAGGDHELTTSNGRIDVTLPAESEFKFKAETSNGRIACDFDYEDDGSSKRRRKAGTIGDDPRFHLELSTSNGPIDINKQ